MDLARLADKKQFAYVDGLSELFCEPQPASPASTPSPTGAGIPPRTTLPVRTLPGAVPGRGPAPTPTLPASKEVARNPAELGIAKKLHFSGRGVPALDALEKDIVSVIEQLKAASDSSEDVLLIIDQPDLLLAATGPSMGIGATEISEWITGLQQVSSLSMITLI